jgi:hypothetical protein
MDGVEPRPYGVVLGIIMDGVEPRPYGIQCDDRVHMIGHYLKNI